MESTSKPTTLRLETDEDPYVQEELEKLEDLEQSVLDYALQNPAASTIHDKLVQARMALSRADIEFRRQCPAEDKETLLNIINHRRQAQDRFELDDESIRALDTILASNVITELTCLAKDPLRYQLDDSIWISPTPAKDTHMYAKLYIRELRLPVNSLTAYMPAYQDERPRDIPCLTAITNEISEARKMVEYNLEWCIK
jgi:D-alanyl-D-alanine carboxypeptidase